MTLASVEFKKTIKRMDAKILFAISLWPLLISLLAITGSGFFVSSGPTLGLVDFLATMIDFQDLIVLPLLVCVYICSMTFFSEIHQKQIYFYKDINRSKVLDAKYKAVFLTFTIFFLMYLIIAVFSYLGIFQFTSSGNGKFISYDDHLLASIFEIFEIYLSQLFYAHIGLSLALRFNTGTSIFLTILAYLLIKTSRFVSWAKYLTPVGYREIIDFPSHSILKTLAISLAIWFVYNFILYILNRKYFNKIDYL